MRKWTVGLSILAIVAVVGAIWWWRKSVNDENNAKEMARRATTQAVAMRNGDVGRVFAAVTDETGRLVVFQHRESDFFDDLDSKEPSVVALTLEASIAGNPVWGEIESSNDAIDGADGVLPRVSSGNLFGGFVGG